MTKYHKYKNPDPSTAKFARVVASELLTEIFPKHIKKRIWELYHLRSDTVLGIDLKHAVIRILSDETKNLVIEIGKFEKRNSSDLRNYPWTEGQEPEPQEVKERERALKAYLAKGDKQQ